MARLNLEFAAPHPQEPEKKPLPSPKYERALELFRDSATFSAAARELDVSVLTVKRYFNWLVNNGYIEANQEELSPREREVVNLVYDKHMSLRETANKLGCSVSNVVYFRNTALRKGYRPPQETD